jgi:hypothetical protein
LGSIVFAWSPGEIPSTWVGSTDFCAGVGDGEGSGEGDGSGDGGGEGSADGSGVGVGVAVSSADGRGEGGSLALDDTATDALGATLAAGAPAHAASVRETMTAIARDRADRRIDELL